MGVARIFLKFQVKEVSNWNIDTRINVTICNLFNLIGAFILLKHIFILYGIIKSITKICIRTYANNVNTYNVHVYSSTLYMHTYPYKHNERYRLVYLFFFLFYSLFLFRIPIENKKNNFTFLQKSARK